MTDFDLDHFVRTERIGAGFAAQVARLHAPLADRIAAAAKGRSRPLVAGICGPQGSGKSTLVSVVAGLLAQGGLRVAVLSLDDLYLPRADRQRLAQAVHPLLATRGPPGTHDPQLGLATLDGLARPGPTALPRFDKASDDRLPQSQWPVFDGPADVILLEGWCLGARPQPAAALVTPVNALEALEDPGGVWRAYVNAALGGAYQDLFARIDRLALLLAPDFATVRAWRGEQEAKLRAKLGDPARTMDEAALDRFMQHYQRLTEWIAQDMPGRADGVARLDAARSGGWDRA